MQSLRSFDLLLNPNMPSFIAKKYKEEPVCWSGVRRCTHCVLEEFPVSDSGEVTLNEYFNGWEQ